MDEIRELTEDELKAKAAEKEYAQVKKIIEHLRPYIMGDGGDIQLVSVEDGVVTVALLGACVGCSMIDVTLNNGIKNWIMEEVPTIKDVVLQQSTPTDFSDFFNY